MRKRILLMVTIFVLCNSFLRSQMVEESEATTAAVHYAALYDLSSSNQVVGVKGMYDSMDRVLLYEVVLSDELTLLVSGYKSCMPVVAYAWGKGAFSAEEFEDIQTGLTDMVARYKLQVSDCINSKYVDTVNVKRWKDLLNGEAKASPSKKGGVIGPLISTQWGQYEPYDYYAPTSTGGCNAAKCAPGCTSVAMAQVMNYWKRPVLLYDQQSQIDWCHMADKIRTWDSLSDELYVRKRDAVSWLIRLCGIKSSTHYCFFGKCESFAGLLEAKSAFEDSFGYNVSYIQKLFRSQNKWAEIIRKNLEEGKPVMYAALSGALSVKGHTFVCDGYNYDDGTFHFNMGNGTSGYWCTIDDITYTFVNSAGDSTTRSYNHYDEALFHLYPKGDEDFCDTKVDMGFFYHIYNSLHPFSEEQTYSVTPATATMLYSADSSLPSTYRSIPSGVTTEYVARQEIVLRPGFSAMAGCHFSARVDPCEACDKQVLYTVKSQTNTQREFVDEKKSAMQEGPSGFQEERLQLQIYPNPSKGVVTVESPVDVKEIRVFGEDGRLSTRFSVRQSSVGKNRLDFTFLDGGVYLIMVGDADGNSYVGKVIIK